MNIALKNHTPGPWAVNCSHIYAPDGAIIAVVHNPGSKESDYPLVANRDLMAAAPELLDALVTAMQWIKAWDVGFLFDDEWTADEAKITAAIAKATGAAS